jgi:heat shock protein HspQ
MASVKAKRKAEAKTARAPRPKRRPVRKAKFGLGEIVRHRFYEFRGIVFDVDPVFSSTDEWWNSIPKEIRPRKDQPYYHLLAENDKTEYIAYVSEQNLLPDDSGAPLRHPQVTELFTELEGSYRATFVRPH